MAAKGLFSLVTAALKVLFMNIVNGLSVRIILPSKHTLTSDLQLPEQIPLQIPVLIQPWKHMHALQIILN